jgi:predicted nucleic acid-binding protein
MATHLLDTSVYCQPLKPRPLPTVVARWTALGDDSLATSVIAEAEVLFGVKLKQSTRLTQAYEQLLRGRLRVLLIDEPVADCFAELKAFLHRSGRPLPDLDLLIAATARAHHLIVATLNPRHFTELEGVVVEDWSRNS